MNMPNQTYLLIGHGSRVPEAVDQFHRFVETLTDQIGRPVRHCFLEFTDPDMRTGLADAAASAGEGGEVIVAPLVLSAGGHQKNDVAAGVQWAREQFPRVVFRQGTPVGPHAKLVDLLDLRITEALDGVSDSVAEEETCVLIAGHGSRDPDSNSTLAQTAYLLFEGRRYRSVEYAFLVVARPDIAQGVHRAAMLGARQLVVAPYLLFAGSADRRIRRIASRAAAELNLHTLHADPLGSHPLLLDVVAQRFQEAADGTAAMVCDICKYRWPMAGHEDQVGEPQTRLPATGQPPG
jgi:sirohydrochlorin cobaltochelatase